MKPVDYRNETFESLKATLRADRERVFRAWQTHGPGTTAEVALKSAISILTFRPRSTDLFQIGFLVLIGDRGAAGVYRAATAAEASAHFQERQLAAQKPAEQMHLAAIGA